MKSIIAIFLSISLIIPPNLSSQNLAPMGAVDSKLGITKTLRENDSKGKHPYDWAPLEKLIRDMKGKIWYHTRMLHQHKQFQLPHPLYRTLFHIAEVKTYYGVNPVIYDVWIYWHGFGGWGDEFSLNIAPRPKDLERFPGMKNILTEDRAAKNFPFGIQGMFGRLWIDIVIKAEDKKPVFTVYGIQSTRGYNKLPPEYKRVYQLWIQAGIKGFLALADYLGFKEVYVTRESEFGNRYNLKPYYIEPFKNEWELTIIRLKHFRRWDSEKINHQRVWTLNSEKATALYQDLYAAPHVEEVFINKDASCVFHKPDERNRDIELTVRFDAKARDISKLKARLRILSIDSIRSGKPDIWKEYKMKLTVDPDKPVYCFNGTLPEGFQGEYYVEYSRNSGKNWQPIFKEIKTNQVVVERVGEKVIEKGHEVHFSLKLNKQNVIAPSKQIKVRLFACDESKIGNKGYRWRFYNSRLIEFREDGTVTFRIMPSRNFYGQGSIRYSIDGGKTWKWANDINIQKISDPDDLIKTSL